MKVLKRPMFKYGGDVKRQGIMHGMNGLRNGGVATTMADATGMANGGIMRQGYQDGLSVQQQIDQQKAKTKALKFLTVSSAEYFFDLSPVKALPKIPFSFLSPLIPSNFNRL